MSVRARGAAGESPARAASAGIDVLQALHEQPGGRELLELARGRSAVALVGGAVRDLLLGRAPRELDVVVAQGPDVFARELASTLSALAGQNPSAAEHERFRTAVVEWAGGRVDVAGQRAESYPEPGALPAVRPARRLEEDLERRDFTVNAIAAALGGSRRGELVFAEHALEDLRAGRLRVLHDASFIDDPTRLLRAARYAARLGFQIEPHTARLAAQAIAHRALNTVSGARIDAELRLALAEADALGALAAMDDLGVLIAVHPRLRCDRATIERALKLLPDDGRRDLLTMAALTLPLAFRAGDDVRAEIVALLDRLEFPAGDRDRIVAAATAVPRLVSELPAATRPSRIYDAVVRVPLEGIALTGAVEKAAARAAGRWLSSLRHVHLAIGGEDLLAAGVAEGPDVGRRLDAALRMKLEGDLADGAEAELNAALRARI
jgi:tRNA nucleotidyltransferase (CCA-adding enzyme)